MVVFKILNPLFINFDLFGFVLFNVVHNKVIQENIIRQPLMPDPRGTNRALINIQHILSQAQLAERMLAGCGHRMCNKVLTDFAEYSDAVDILLLLFLGLVFLVGFLLVLALGRAGFLLFG